MNKENSNNNDRKCVVHTPAPEMCIKIFCLMCKDSLPDCRFVCDDFSCPLWLYQPGEAADFDDLHEKADMYLSACKRIYESK